MDLRTEISVTFDDVYDGEFGDLEGHAFDNSQEPDTDGKCLDIGLLTGSFCRIGSNYVDYLESISDDMESPAEMLYLNSDWLGDTLGGGIGNIYLIGSLEIELQYRNLGAGSKLMSDFRNVATDSICILNAYPIQTAQQKPPTPKDTKRLVRFYERFEFRKIKPRSNIMLADFSWKPGNCPVPAGSSWSTFATQQRRAMRP